MLNLVRARMERLISAVAPLETKEFMPKAIFKFSTNVQEYMNGTYSSQHRWGCYESLFAGECSRKSCASY